MQSILRPALVLFGALTLAVGVLYPLAVTGIGRVAFPDQAAGSLVTHRDKVVGSALIGQSFTSPRYFWGRPSATAPMASNAAGSSGSNQGALNPALAETVKTRRDTLLAADPGNMAPVPVDLVTASASGLDPEISVAAASYQAGRVARERGLARARVDELISRHTVAQHLGFLGEARVNVLALNLALDNEPRPAR
ncbi:potassium-transporting ATPase subunit KdpC [Massilia sp. X63]|jgi:K+-transporting ATPase ATPase C chain|uniref:potassium-transporting ATPase subunit KdpC n=1 Tax=Massilia sp. X63 TaxID=3237285 RepID=UPI0034DDAB23